jgi:energy-coupling factor transporter transmembrane protein EcfT
MSKPVLITIGIVVTLLGLLFTLQGLGVVGGSAMTGSTLWAVLGPIIAIVGIAVLVLGFRKGRTP